MPATKFICPNGERVLIKDCLASCKQKERCMFLPTLRAVAESLDRGIKEANVNEDISVIQRLVKAGEVMDVQVLDHIILGDGQFVSMKEKDLMG